MSKALLFNEYSVNSFLFIKFLLSDRDSGKCGEDLVC